MGLFIKHAEVYILIVNLTFPSSKSSNEYFYYLYFYLIKFKYFSTLLPKSFVIFALCYYTWKSMDEP